MRNEDPEINGDLAVLFNHLLHTTSHLSPEGHQSLRMRPLRTIVLSEKAFLSGEVAFTEKPRPNRTPAVEYHQGDLVTIGDIVIFDPYLMHYLPAADFHRVNRQIALQRWAANNAEIILRCEQGNQFLVIPTEETIRRLFIQGRKAELIDESAAVYVFGNLGDATVMLLNEVPSALDFQCVFCTSQSPYEVMRQVLQAGHRLGANDSAN